MPNWTEIAREIEAEIKKGNKQPFDPIKNKYLQALSEYTGRNSIAYYSAFLQKPGTPFTSIDDKDKVAFMTTINNLDRSKGLDLILHTPGGGIAATESIIYYLFSMFNGDIRAVIPQISMSAGTMIALSCKSIIMGKQSNLGPIDPQMGGLACEAVLAEFQQAKNDIKVNPHAAPLWQVIISKYHPTFLTACSQAIDWSKRVVKNALEKNMCVDNPDRAARILNVFADHATQKSHDRHISMEECKAAGVEIIEMEQDQTLQDLILSVHHAFIHTLTRSAAVKIVQNQKGVAFVDAFQVPSK